MNNKFETLINYSIIYCQSRTGMKFEVFVDNNTIERLSKDRYSVSCHWDKKGKNYYAVITEYLGKNEAGKPSYKSIQLHRFILDIYLADIIVDHKNGNTLDDRKENLRKTNKSGNCKNRKGANKNNTSGYRNVCWMHGYWRIQLQKDGKNYLFPEKFKDVCKAGEFAKKMRNEFYGEFSGN